MSEIEQYQRIYERERQARLLAERLLQEKSRELYDKILELQETLDQLHSAQAQLVQSEKMASVGLLAAGVAHEINNPIGFCLSNLNTLRDYSHAYIGIVALVTQHKAEIANTDFYRNYQDYYQRHDIGFVESDLTDMLQETSGGLLRVKDIVTSLQSVSHSSDGRFVECELNSCIESTLHMVWNQFKYTMEVEQRLDEALPKINGISAELQQVFMNLFINASHACEAQGKLTISTDSVVEKGKRWVRVTVADNGHGMNQDIINKVFDPFFTTKPVGVGTGLGLSISYSIVEKHGGKMQVESEVGQGTTFILLFPTI
ncbi:sensor histidine kinase [Vibrio anguillarum]|uniref:histidine kinase n=1 Tax=Vibrio anguillarum TaxID=55601 RepID=A0ABD4QUN7_VIBAN|nr:ATP-binding protein [Vibrio anguillarum]MBT2918720.1 ATP-binding protein [Vibrio anguillarum]